MCRPLRAGLAISVLVVSEWVAVRGSVQADGIRRMPAKFAGDAAA